MVIKCNSSLRCGFAASEDGHNKLLDCYCTPSEPFFESSLSGERVWLFPPVELIGVTLKFVVNQSKKVADFACCILLPERTSAYWFRYLQHFRRIERYSTGSDLFRIQSSNGFVRASKSNEPWLVVGLNM